MGKNGPLGRGDDGRGTRVRVVGPSRARPAALKGATGRIGKIPTYVKRSRALKSARSFSPKFRAGRRRVSPTPSPTSTNPANVCLTRPGAPAPPLEPFLGVRISEHPKSRTCYEKPDLICPALARARTPTPVDATPKEKSDKIRYAARATRALEQHEPDVLGAHLGALPVVEVVLEVPVADAKFQILEELVVLHDVQRIEDVHLDVPSAY